MNQKILLQTTLPTVLIGLLLFGGCVASAWYIQRLQSNLAGIIRNNVVSQNASQELEIQIRRLRFHSFLYLIEPTPKRGDWIKEDHALIESALRAARQSSATPEEQHCVEEIDQGYRRYHEEIDQLLAAGAPDASRSDLARLAEEHPVRLIVEPMQQLLVLNNDAMEQTVQESQRVTSQAHLTMIVLGILGPAGGVLAGYGFARALSRSIYRLGVRVRDMASRLDQDVASVSIEADGDIQGLDRQLEYVVRRVEEVTERQQEHQRAMLRAEQLSAVGQLAASVAHEVRNPLTAVKLLVEIALRSGNRKPLTLDDLKVIHREVTRLEQTVQGLLDFARPPVPQRSDWDLRELLTETVELVRPRAGQQKVEIRVVRPEVATVGNVDRAQFRTVLVNLLLNALDAMPQGGVLRVGLESSAGGDLFLSVTDSGKGIEPNILGRLFTPFLSTKPTGTGLGLSISRRIVEEHGGQLSGTNLPAGGACFTVSLPAVVRPDPVPDPAVLPGE